MRASAAIAGAAVLSLLLCAAGCASPAPDPGQGGPTATGASQDDQQEIKHYSSVVVEVNGQPLYRALYEQTLEYIRTRLSESSASADVERYIKAQYEALDMIVNDELLYQEARRRGIVVPDEDVAAEYLRVVGGAGGERAFLTRMQTQQVTRFEAIEGIRKRMAIDRFIEQSIASGLHASDDEALEYYNTHLDRFTPDTWVKLAQILVRLPSRPDDGQVQRARSRADKILANIRAGRPFEEMAREFSEDGSAEQDGVLGYFKRGAGPPEIEAVAFAMAEGGVSEPIRSPEGFHIVKVLEKKGGAPQDYSLVKEKCRKAVLNQKQAEAIENVLSRLRASAQIQSYLE